MFFSAGEPRAMGGNLVRPNEYSFHMEVRTLYARRMFRELVSSEIQTLTVCALINLHENIIELGFLEIISRKPTRKVGFLEIFMCILINLTTFGHFFTHFDTF